MRTTHRMARGYRCAGLCAYRLPHRNKKGRIRAPRNGRLIGYAEHQAEAPGYRHMRRIFWLKPCDRDSDPTGPYAVNTPQEAVDPRTVKPGIIGYRTERAKGRANTQFI